ncbi:uncharacterized protein LOC111896692 isoform X3 [Lactuca sativa]|uniref:uncharacterized protein LOC111896692 isoform X3 n=1 Tax=Lactuca sativa TaxID=4236 RepID=UPI000CD82A44|nr:uncharacterized protein LOC111896692 isoform X3 [Lactuca sativa]
MFEEEPNQPKIAQERIKFQQILEKGEEDGISALPDSLLLEILSRLPSTKHAIRTDLSESHRLQNPNLRFFLVCKLKVSFFHQM